MRDIDLCKKNGKQLIPEKSICIKIIKEKNFKLLFLDKHCILSAE